MPPCLSAYCDGADLAAMNVRVLRRGHTQCLRNLCRRPTGAQKDESVKNKTGTIRIRVQKCSGEIKYGNLGFLTFFSLPVFTAHLQ